MKRASAMCLIIFTLLTGCGVTDYDLNNAYEDGYLDGKNEVERKIETIEKEAYENGFMDGVSSVPVEPFYEDDIRMEEYANGFEDGYYDGRKDEKVGAPDQLEDFEAWYYFWYGTYIKPYNQSD